MLENLSHVGMLLATVDALSPMLAESVYEIIRDEQVLWIITFCSVVSLGITLERLLTMRKADVNSEALLQQLSGMIDSGDIDGAITVCDSAGGPVGDTLGTGLRKMQLLERIGKNPDEIEEGIVAAMEERGLHTITFMERNLGALATLASLAPILGMLGTVLGMIKAFLEMQKGGMTSEAVAAGIGQALYCTAGGLIVAAMATVEYNYFTSRVNRFTVQVQAAATKLVERLLHRQIKDRKPVLAGGKRLDEIPMAQRIEE